MAKRIGDFRAAVDRPLEGPRDDRCSPIHGSPAGGTRFEAERFGTISVLTVRGEVDIFTSPMLDTAIADIFRGHYGAVVLSFLDCTFADCSCLNVLIRKSKELAVCLFIVAPPASALGRILALTQLTRALPVYSSLRQAYLAILADPSARLGDLAIWA